MEAAVNQCRTVGPIDQYPMHLEFNWDSPTFLPFFWDTEFAPEMGWFLLHSHDFPKNLGYTDCDKYVYGVYIYTYAYTYLISRASGDFPSKTFGFWCWLFVVIFAIRLEVGHRLGMPNQEFLNLFKAWNKHEKFAESCGKKVPAYWAYTVKRCEL